MILPPVEIYNFARIRILGRAGSSHCSRLSTELELALVNAR
jgi:hypothetical protein